MHLKIKSMEHLQSIETYEPGLLVSEVSRRFGIPAEKVVKLASGENPSGPSLSIMGSSWSRLSSVLEKQS